MCRRDPDIDSADFPHNPPCFNRDAAWWRRDADGLESVGTLLARHVAARRVHRDNPTRGGAR